MRVAIVGATGNVGSRLLEVLVTDPAVERVVAIARRKPPTLPPGAEWRQADLDQRLPDGLLDGCSAVVHLAWLFQPSHAPQVTWNANVIGTLRLLHAAETAGIGSFIHASSSLVYSPRIGTDPVDETWPAHGIASASYSVEKAYVERLLDEFEAESGTRVVRLRPAFIFREEASVEQRRLFLGPLAPTRMLTRLGLPVVPDPGGLLLQAVHTDDVVEAYRLALTRPVTGAFNIAAEPVLTIADIGRQLGARVVRVPARAARAAVRTAWGLHLVPASPGMFDMAAQVPMLDSSRARRDLGWLPRHDSHQAIAALLAGMRSAKGGPTPPLDPASSGPLRAEEFRSGVGSRP